jgi:hypothetical protein
MSSVVIESNVAMLSFMLLKGFETKAYMHPLQDLFSCIKIVTIVFYQGRQKRLIFCKVRFWPYSLHNAVI